MEVCQAVCEYLGWGYEAVPFNWDAKDAELAAGSCDCIWSGFTVEGREDDYLWSDPYSNNTQLILTTEDSGIETLADLTGKIVGVQTATSAYDLLQDAEADLCATFASLEVYETYTIAFADLQAGAIDAIAIDATAGGYLISGLEGYKFLDEDLGTETYAIGFRLEDVERRDRSEALKPWPPTAPSTRLPPTTTTRISATSCAWVTKPCQYRDMGCRKAVHILL